METEYLGIGNGQSDAAEAVSLIEML